MIRKNIYGNNRLEVNTKVRYASRGIIILNNNILLVHELVDNQYMIPGGGLESGETMRECCIREVEEETGYIVELIASPVEITEYYEEYKYVTAYFICKIIGEGNKHLTNQEEKLNMITEWVSFADCLNIFSQPINGKWPEEKQGLYLREYTALSNI